jgi:hypothetical protein
MSGLSPQKESPVATRLEQETAHAAPLSPQQTPQAAALSQWLQLMLAEIARKRDDLESARAEAARRALEGTPQEIADRATDGAPHGRPSER